ncbi:MAG: hypothetical protein ACXIUP_04785 [Microcella sp.]
MEAGSAELVTRVLTVAALVALVGLVLYLLGTRRRTAAGDPSRIPGVVAVIALISAAVTAITTVTGAIAAAVGEQVTLTVPVRPFTLEPLPQIISIDGPTAEAIGGPGFTEGTFVVEGLDVTARLWLVSGMLVNGIVLVLLLMAVFVVARRARLSDPFSQPLSPVLGTTGTLLGVGSVIWQICFLVAGNLAAAQLFGVRGLTAVGLDEGQRERLRAQGLDSSGFPMPGSEGTIEFWPIGVGLALIALAAVFRSGERLQRDTEGLV